MFRHGLSLPLRGLKYSSMSNIYLSEIINLHEPSGGDGYPFNIPVTKSLK